MQQPSPDLGRLTVEVSNSHTVTHHTQQNFSGRGIGPLQRIFINITMRPSFKNYVCMFLQIKKNNVNIIQTQLRDQRTEVTLVTLLYSPFNHLKRLLVREYFTECGRCESFKLYNIHFTRWLCFTSSSSFTASDQTLQSFIMNQSNPPPPLSILLAAGWRLSCFYEGSLRPL